MDNNEFDVVVIGGGAAGLSAALMVGRSLRSVLVVDAGETRNRFAAEMHGVLGNEGTSPADLVARGRVEVEQYGVQFAAERVAAVAGPADGPVLVTAESGRRWSARAVIVATGVGDRLPDIPGLAERWGHSVLHCPYCHGWEVRGRRLGVLATSAFGLHQVQMVRQLSDDVVLFLPSDVPLAETDERRLSARNVRIVRTAVEEILGEGRDISGARLADGSIEQIEAVFTIGTPVLHDGFLDGLGLQRTDGPWGSFLTVDEFGRTTHPRIWAAGNVVNPMANVPLAMGNGSFVGAAVNGFLVTEDFDRASRTVGSMAGRR